VKARKNYEATASGAWTAVLDTLLDDKKKLEPNELAVLRVYFAFLGKDSPLQSIPAFLAACKKHLMRNRTNLGKT
jgi:hypothetical protein